jgi:hypothetical protein
MLVLNWSPSLCIVNLVLNSFSKFRLDDMVCYDNSIDLPNIVTNIHGVELANCVHTFLGACPPP